jgi:hypothetical protein
MLCSLSLVEEAINQKLSAPGVIHPPTGLVYAKSNSSQSWPTGISNVWQLPHGRFPCGVPRPHMDHLQTP